MLRDASGGSLGGLKRSPSRGWREKLRKRPVVLAAALVLLIAASAAVIAFRPSGPGQTSTSSSSSSLSTSAATTEGYSKGLTFTPASYDGQGITSFFATAGQAGQVVTWAGDWDALSDPQSAPYVVEAQAQKDGLSFIPELQVLNASTGELLRPLNASNEAEYRSLAVSFAQRYKPGYMALGIEVNLLHESAPADYQAFAALFNATRAAVKEASPGTAVFTIFQLEKMKGLDGGLFGGVNDTSKAEWSLLGDFASADLVGFTTYPGLVYHDPSSIPGGYYAEIADHTDKPIAFTEVGWQSQGLQGWPNSEASQAAFVGAFFNLTKGLDMAVVVWAFAYDQAAPAPFGSMGLFTGEGTAKAAWQAWTEDG